MTTLTLSRLLLCLKIVSFALTVYGFLALPHAIYAKGAKFVLSIAIWWLERRIKQ